MLNILVCVKQVPDINLVKMDPVTGSLIRAGVPAILNPLDANALEAAVRVKEAHGGTVDVETPAGGGATIVVTLPAEVTAPRNIPYEVEIAGG